MVGARNASVGLPGQNPPIKKILQLCFAIIVLGGIGRVVSLVQVGVPETSTASTFIAVALTIELLLVPLAWLALHRAVMTTD